MDIRIIPLLQSDDGAYLTPGCTLVSLAAKYGPDNEYNVKIRDISLTNRVIIAADISTRFHSNIHEIEVPIAGTITFKDSDGIHKIETDFNDKLKKVLWVDSCNPARVFEFDSLVEVHWKRDYEKYDYTIPLRRTYGRLASIGSNYLTIDSSEEERSDLINISIDDIYGIYVYNGN